MKKIIRGSGPGARSLARSHSEASPALRRLVPPWPVYLAAVLLFAPPQSWAAAFGGVRGVVQTANGKPVAGARVKLVSPAGEVRTTRTDARGRFDFPTVAVGTYRISASRDGASAASQAVTVEPGYYPSPHLILQRAVSLARVTISAAAMAPPVVASVTPITLVSQVDIQRTPGADLTNSMAMITDYVPGAYMVHDQLHVRGGHQTAWLVNGVEIPNTNIGSNLGPTIDPEDIQTLGVERGSYQADNGDRTYGIFNVIPKSGFGRHNEGVLDVTGGNYGQTNDYLSVGSHTGHFAYYASIDGNRSNLGIETPVAQVIHDAERGYGGFANLQYDPSGQNEVRFVFQSRADQYQIPNYPGEMANDVQREADTFAVLSWEHTFAHDAVLTSSLLYHYNRANYDGGANDSPVSTTDHSSSTYEGGQEDLRLHFGRHDHLSIGVFGFAQQDRHFFHLLFNASPLAGALPPPLSETNSPAGSLVAAWIQDTYKPAHWLSLSAGLRQTHFQGQVTENASDPRVGISVVVPHLNWVLSAFWGKYYQAPPLATLSGPLVGYANGNDTGFLPLHGERDTERQFGVAIPIEGWSIEADYFVNEARNFFDHNAIGNSDIFLPLTDQGALIKAYELAVRSPPFWRYGQAHVAFSNQTADGFGGITGGLTSFTPGTGYYALDHDQRNTLNTGFDANLPRGYFASVNIYVGSGFANGNAPPSHLPSHAELDLGVGKTIGRDLTLSLTALNVTNRHLLTDNSVTFGGVHWNNPREVYAEVHYRFHY
ncbi:MAG TPA: TonB-dependent receptor [Steroidobacteraceae bacterium]|nr:TonB-dependent receptor [Steroidobacteraceae bacterium]